MISTEAEKKLIEQLKSADNIAFQTLISTYSKTVFNTCLHFLQNKEDAEDICQEVFVSVYQSINQFKGDAKLSTWLYRIAVTKSLDYIRMKNRKKRFGFMRSLFNAESNEPIFEQLHTEHPGKILENQERLNILFIALDKLPENQKTAFILNKIEHLSYAEVADIMHISVSAVESLLFRSKQNLQKLLATYYKENEQ